jgi:hypothetical protein
MLLFTCTKETSMSGHKFPALLLIGGERSIPPELLAQLETIRPRHLVYVEVDSGMLASSSKVELVPPPETGVSHQVVGRGDGVGLSVANWFARLIAAPEYKPRGGRKSVRTAYFGRTE